MFNERDTYNASSFKCFFFHCHSFVFRGCAKNLPPVVDLHATLCLGGLGFGSTFDIETRSSCLRSVFSGVGVSGVERFWRVFFGERMELMELKVHGLDDVDDRDVCFILIFDFYSW